MTSTSEVVDDYPPPAEQSGCDNSDSESYAAAGEQAISTVEDGVSEGDLKAIFRVAQVMEDMTGRCFHCGKEGHWFRDPECPMYDANDLLNQQRGSAGPRRPGQIPNLLNTTRTRVGQRDEAHPAPNRIQ